VNPSRFPWSEGFDHIFRNEGVTGSNPVSSTKDPGQGDFGERVGSPFIQFVIRASTGDPQGLLPKHLFFREVLWS